MRTGQDALLKFSGSRIKSGMTAVKKFFFDSCLQFLSTQILSYIDKKCGLHDLEQFAEWRHMLPDTIIRSWSRFLNLESRILYLVPAPWPLICIQWSTLKIPCAGDCIFFLAAYYCRIKVVPAPINCSHAESRIIQDLSSQFEDRLGRVGHLTDESEKFTTFISQQIELCKIWIWGLYYLQFVFGRKQKRWIEINHGNSMPNENCS